MEGDEFRSQPLGGLTHGLTLQSPSARPWAQAIALVVPSLNMHPADPVLLGIQFFFFPARIYPSQGPTRATVISLRSQLHLAGVDAVRLSEQHTAGRSRATADHMQTNTFALASLASFLSTIISPIPPWLSSSSSPSAPQSSVIPAASRPICRRFVSTHGAKMVVANFSTFLGAQNGPKSLSIKLRGWGSKIRALCLLVAIVWLTRVVLYFEPTLSPMFGMRVRALDAAAHDIWTDYIATHPVEIDDRYGLREMGFRAHAYAEFARTGQIGRLERIEEHLWSYAPAVAEIRRTALRVRPKAAEPVEDPVEARVSAQLKKSGRLSANQTAALLTAAELEEAAQGGKSRGIVMVVSRYTALAALQTITVLRQLHGCLLPIEIYYHTEDELPDGLVDMFKTLGRVSAFNIDTLPYFNSDLEDDAGRYPGLKVTWERESLALLASSFQEILVVDPEVVFLQNPSLLFSHPTFASTGTLFFRAKAKPVDRASQYLVSFLKRQIDQGSPSQQLAESAFFSHGIGARMDMDVVVLDKSRPGVLSALLMNAWMRRRMARALFWGSYVGMMREALWLAFELSDIEYAFENTWPGAIGRFDGEWDDHSPQLCSPRTLQFLSPQAAHQKLSRKYFSLFQSHGSKTSGKSVASKHKDNAVGEKPFWFHGGVLVPRQTDETYFSPNVYARNAPPYTTVDEDSSDSDSCLYGATLNRLKGTIVPSTLQKAIEIAHEAFMTYRSTLMHYAPLPAPINSKP